MPEEGDTSRMKSGRGENSQASHYYVREFGRGRELRNIGWYITKYDGHVSRKDKTGYPIRTPNVKAGLEMFVMACANLYYHPPS